MRVALQHLLAQRRVLVVDGAMGTNLQAAGLALGAAPERWLDEHPERVAALHRAFVAAGADVVLTDSFGANRFRLAATGAEGGRGAYDLARQAALLARRAADQADRPVVVAGSVGPTGARPGALDESDAFDVFVEPLEGLRDGGADVAWIETMGSVAEARAAARAALAVGLPYVVTFSFHGTGRVAGAIAPADVADAFAGLAAPPLAVGANCGEGPDDVIAAVRRLGQAQARSDGAPMSAPALVAKAGAGLPTIVDGAAVYALDDGTVAAYARASLGAGARLVGGCCGFTPHHVTVLRTAVDEAVAAGA